VSTREMTEAEKNLVPTPPTPSETAKKKSRGSGALASALGTAALPVGTLITVLLAWQYIPGLLDVPPFIFPELTSVLAKFTSSATLEVLYDNLLVTMHEALLGLVIGAAAGTLAGFVLGEFATLRTSFYPFLIAFQSMPKVAVAPLFVIWFGFGVTPKVLVVVILCFFPMLVNTMTGVMSVDRSKLDLFRSLSASRLQIWRRLLLPASLPPIFAGLEVAVVFSLLGAITGEFVGADAGLGVVLQQYKTNYDTAGVFAILMLLSAAGVIMNQTVRLARRKLLFWQE
jgi:NitT/TauT family transport system permease protein